MSARRGDVRRRFGVRGFAPLAVSVIVTGCGAKTTIEAPFGTTSGSVSASTGSGGQGGNGGSMGGAGGAGGAIPPECEVPVSGSPPYAVTFRFENPSSELLFMRQKCWRTFAITACAQGYGPALQLWPECSVDCADPEPDCMLCEMCLDEGIPVPPGASSDVAWPGLTYTFDINAIGCTCHEEHAEPAGVHRIQVPVYWTEQAAQLDEVAYEASVDFALPAPGGVVVVPLAPML